jgi:hypothetical protein
MTYSVREAVEHVTAGIKGPLGGVAQVVASPGVTLAANPSVVIGLPAFTWETGCPDPTSLRLLLYVVVDESERAAEELWDLVPVVATAVDEHTVAVTIRADPGSYMSGGTPLPAYLLQIEVPL